MFKLRQQSRATILKKESLFSFRDR